MCPRLSHLFPLLVQVHHTVSHGYPSIYIQGSFLLDDTFTQTFSLFSPAPARLILPFYVSVLKTPIGPSYKPTWRVRQRAQRPSEPPVSGRSFPPSRRRPTWPQSLGPRTQRSSGRGRRVPGRRGWSGGARIRGYGDRRSGRRVTRLRSLTVKKGLSINQGGQTYHPGSR